MLPLGMGDPGEPVENPKQFCKDCGFEIKSIPARCVHCPSCGNMFLNNTTVFEKEKAG
jgi:hypothetical protein